MSIRTPARWPGPLSAKPDCAGVQVGQLLLDPAVQRQFRGSLVEMENMTAQAKALQEELQAVQFSQDSKAGRMLMAKCRALQACALRIH